MKKLLQSLLFVILLAVIPLSTEVYADSTYCASYGHTWSEWANVQEATIKSPGIQERECFSCGVTETQQTAVLTPYASLKKTVKIYVGKTYKLKGSFANGDKIKKWKVSKKGVISLNKAGKIKGLRPGTVKVTMVLRSGKKATCKVTVRAKKKTSASSKRSGGGGTVYWVSGGAVYHSTSSCRTLSRSRSILSGPLSSCPKPRPCKVCF